MKSYPRVIIPMTCLFLDGPRLSVDLGWGWNRFFFSFPLTAASIPIDSSEKKGTERRASRPKAIDKTFFDEARGVADPAEVK